MIDYKNCVTLHVELGDGSVICVDCYGDRDAVTLAMTTPGAAHVAALRKRGIEAVSVREARLPRGYGNLTTRRSRRPGSPVEKPIAFFRKDLKRELPLPRRAGVDNAQGSPHGQAGLGAHESPERAQDTALAGTEER